MFMRLYDRSKNTSAGTCCPLPLSPSNGWGGDHYIPPEVTPPTHHNHRFRGWFLAGARPRARVVAMGKIGRVAQECANGAATSRRRGCLRAISRPYLCRDTPIVMVEYLRVSNLREMLFCRQTDSLENLGESRVGAQRVQPRLPLGVNKKCGTLGDCLL
jgi:hypothetical protein